MGRVIIKWDILVRLVLLGHKYRANYPLPSRKSGINSVWIEALINGLHFPKSLGCFAAVAAAQAVWNFNTIIKVYLCVDTHSSAVLFSFPITDESLERIVERKHKTKIFKLINSNLNFYWTKSNFCVRTRLSQYLMSIMIIRRVSIAIDFGRDY